MPSQSPPAGEAAAPPASPWYRMPMLAAAVYCAVVMAITVAALLLPLN
jgi:hypothetical protein